MLSCRRCSCCGFRGPFLTSPLGANFDTPGAKLSPWGEVNPPGVKFSVRPSILLISI
jgi:hypothetical protein